MTGKITLVVSENDQITETLTKETLLSPRNLIESLLEFQRSANDSLTKLILSAGDAIEMPYTEDENSAEDSETEVSVPVSPKKRKT